MDLAGYNDKKVRVFLKDGSTFEGYASHNSFEYSYAEFGVDAECLQICEYLIRDREIGRIELMEAPPSIRSLPDARLAGIPIIAMTANAFQEDIKKAAEIGMNGHIAKPLDIPGMKATLQQVLKNTSG